MSRTQAINATSVVLKVLKRRKGFDEWWDGIDEGDQLNIALAIIDALVVVG